MELSLAKLKPKNPTKSNLELEIKLDKLFDYEIPDNQDFKEVVGQAIIDTIVKRTQKNRSLSGTKFTKYSKKYAKQKGVPRSKVDLTLTSDMLESIDIKSIKGDTIVISPSDEETPKAYNHHTGDTLPKREFFGLQTREIKKLKKEFKAEAKELVELEKGKETREEKSEIDSIIDALTKGVLDFG